MKRMNFEYRLDFHSGISDSELMKHEKIAVAMVNNGEVEYMLGKKRIKTFIVSF